MGCWKKTGWLVLLVAGGMLSGCVGGPLPQKAAWPWEHAKDTGNYQTGEYLTIRGNVANFDEAPKTVKPVNPEDLKTHDPESKTAPETPLTKTHAPVLPTKSATASGTIRDSAQGDYDFTVRDIQLAPLSYLPAEAVRTACDLTAVNHGRAPVSVSIGIDPAASQNIATDKTLPLNAVVAPNSDQALVRIGPKVKNEGYSFKYSYSWSIGDFTAIHNCPEHYRFPFGYNIKALASASDSANSSAYTRNAVFFSMPVGSPVLAARKGRVVQIRANKIDVLHDDATIATYGHLGTIAEGIVAGKSVSTEDIIGVVGSVGDQNEAYLQLTVWRPEPRPVASLKTVSQGAGFDFVSFPLEFCSTVSGECRVISHDQIVSRDRMADAKKPGKRKSKPITRKDVSP